MRTSVLTLVVLCDNQAIDGMANFDCFLVAGGEGVFEQVREEL